LTSSVNSVDLVVLVPDKQMEATFRSVLQRSESLKIAAVSAEILVHPRRDPGCRGESVDLLSVFLHRSRYAMVAFDRDGCGKEQLTRELLEANLESSLEESGWKNRCAVVVIDPELEAWIWSDSPLVDQTLGWSGASPTLREWLESKQFIVSEQRKPPHPKEALEAALKLKRKRRSASLYGDLAAKVSLSRCIDPAFQKLKTILQSWFQTAE